MPPRYVYWTIIVDGQPTAFRSGSLEDIMPTFNRLKEKQPNAELKWFQHGKLWPSRHDAQDFMRARGDRGRERDPRQSEYAGGEKRWDAKPAWKTRSSFKPRDNDGAGAGSSRSAKPQGEKPVWVPRSASTPKPEDEQISSWDEEPSAEPSDFAAPADKPTRRAPSDKPAWKPKDTFTPAARRDDDRPRKSFGDGDKPAWKPKRDERDGVASGFSRSDSKPAWKPKGAAASRGSFDRDDRPAGQARGSKPPEWKPKGTFKPKEAGHSSGWGEKPGWKSKRDAEGKPAWKPKGDKPAWKSDGDKPAWKPKGDAGGKPEWKPKGTFRPKEEGHRPSARDEARSSFRPKSYTPKEEGAGPSRSSKARDQKLEWNPKEAERRGDGPNAGFAKSDPGGPKRKWVPKAEYKKSLGIEAKRDDKWRPGGEHKDPKQKYKDAKKAKWTKFKANIRARSTKPRKQED